jgi:putative endonuclease
LLGWAVVSRSRLQLGKTGEDLACRELERRGYAIIARRHRCRVGEIDIVAWDGPTLVFVEVKARRDTAFGRPAEAVTFHKRRRLMRLAGEYVLRYRLEGRPCRFDVVAIRWEADRAAVEIFQNAFPATG